MGRRRRFLPALTASLAVLLVAGGCRSKQSATASSAAPVEPAAQLRMAGMTVQSWGPAGMEWEMRAPLGEGFTLRNILRVSNMNVQLFDQGERSTDIAAGRAIMATGDRPVDPKVAVKPIEPEPGVSLLPGDMYMNGGVVLVSTEGSKVTTEWVKYTADDQIIRSSAPVEVIRPDSVTRGIGLEANSDLSRLKIFKQTLVIPGKKGEK